jgi:Bacterial type II and III secretion system protein
VVPSTAGVPSARLLTGPPPSVTQTYSLVTLSGQSASMFMGGEQPVPQSDGHGGTAVVFEPFGAELQFLPVVLPDNSINLQLNIQQSALTENGELKGNGTDVEGRTTLGVQTTVNLKGGQTLVLVQDPTVPFQVSVTPQVLPGSTPMVQVTVTVVSPSGLIDALPESVRPTPQGQPAITD